MNYREALTCDDGVGWYSLRGRIPIMSPPAPPLSYGPDLVLRDPHSSRNMGQSAPQIGCLPVTAAIQQRSGYRWSRVNRDPFMIAAPPSCARVSRSWPNDSRHAPRQGSPRGTSRLRVCTVGRAHGGATHACRMPRRREAPEDPRMMGGQPSPHRPARYPLSYFHSATIAC